MFKITLNNINPDLFVKHFLDDKCACLYADFNIINLLYEAGSSVDQPGILFYPDSTAVHLAANLILHRKTGYLVSTDLLNEILIHAVNKSLRIFFFGDSHDVLNSLIVKLKSVHKRINISGVHNGYNFSNDFVIDQINNSNTDLLFVGIGSGRQEVWINENFEKLKCKMIFSCGGWFQLLSGNKYRAPKFLRNIHCEWLYKLITEFPRVWRRYLVGIPCFYYRIISGKVNIDLL